MPLEIRKYVPCQAHSVCPGHFDVELDGEPISDPFPIEKLAFWERIIRMVDSHPGLLAAAEEALAGIDQMGSDWSDRVGEQLRMEIAKAKGN